MTTKTILLGIVLFGSYLLTAQADPKVYSIERTSTPPKIDGLGNDETWSGVPIATDFSMLDPDNGIPEPYERRTEVKLVFDDEAIYVFARMYDNQPDSILHQLSKRDNYEVNTDYFGIFINPFNDGLSDFNFWVTAAGVQADSRTTDAGDDNTWNTVWESEVVLDDLGWTAEFKIPYQCLRFSDAKVKDWGLNMMRYTRRFRENYTWNFIDKSVATYEMQTGLLRGMEEIEPPVRLSVMPYVSAYENIYPPDPNTGDVSTSESLNFGMDLKYGINESFTLDATLIPDFGQVAFDEQFLNLGPFENQFQENRQFFVEGTDLFSKGDIFYSRRIGGTPKNITNADVSNLSNETQDYTRILNATKVSGRTSGNLGIGVMNAITDNNYLSGTDSLGNEVEVLTEPLTNYNILVLDQRFNRNRAISLVNTNVIRNGDARDANVTAFIADINTNSNTYKFYGEGKYSLINQGDSTIGDASAYIEVSKIKGQWRWEASQTYIGDQYDQNDLGFQSRNNRFGHFLSGSYQIFQPKGVFNKYRFSVEGARWMLANPMVFEKAYVAGSFFFVTKNFFAFGGNVEWQPVESNDYFEPRVSDRVFVRPTAYKTSVWISPDYRKPLAVDVNLSYSQTPDFNSNVVSLGVKPILRVNDRWNMFYEIIPQHESNNIGWSAFKGDSIIMGGREISTVQQSFGSTFIFTPKMSLQFNFRHYWRALKYNQYYNLEDDGGISAINEDFNRDLNFNTLNMDLKFSWWYAPGSELILLYRNTLINNDQNVTSSFGENFSNALSTPSTHIFSLRLTYFLDYATLAK